MKQANYTFHVLEKIMKEVGVTEQEDSPVHLELK